jgi:SAM-dependent methyltransferase
MTDTSNADQIAYWNGRAGQSWTDLQDGMDRSLAGVTGVLLDAAAPRAAERVLDVGCGTGETTLLVADAIGTSGTVTGVDVSAPMLELAAVRSDGRTNVRWSLADAATADLGGPYDLVLSRFGVMFFVDPVVAFTNVARAMRPGARLVFACWQDLTQSDWLSLPMRTIRPLLEAAPTAPPDPDAPGPGAFARPERVRSILERAGFRAIAIAPHTTSVVLGRDPDDALVQMMRIGPVARAVAEESPAVRDRVKSALHAMLVGLAARGPLALDASFWLVTATR